MELKTETHILKLKHRRVKLKIIEEPQRVVFTISFDAVGYFGDLSELLSWLRPLFEKYDSDPRPVVMRNPNSGETATVFDGFAILEPPSIDDLIDKDILREPPYCL